MNTENLLLAVRPIYILIPRPGDSTTSQPKFWAMLLDGLNPIHIKNAAKALRDSRKSPDRPVSKDSSLKLSDLHHGLARALGSKSFDAWCNTEREIIEFLQARGMTKPVDLISWHPMRNHRLTARQVSDRLFNSGLPMPKKIFTGVGSKFFAANSIGSEDIKRLAGHDIQNKEDQLQWCENRATQVVATLKREEYCDAEVSETLELTGRELLLNAFRFNSISPIFNLLGDNLVAPMQRPPEFCLYGASEDELAFDRKVFDIFRQEIERSESGWVEVIRLPGNDNLVFLKGAGGEFDWVVKNQRSETFSSNPLFPFFNKDELPRAMDTSQVKAHQYFSRGGWQEKLEHDAETRHYEQGGLANNWPGYDKLIERELMASQGFVPPKRIDGPLSDLFVSHRIDNYQLMVSPLITINEFNSFLTETDWVQVRLDKARKANIQLEPDLMSVNGNDSGNLPASVTWFDAVAYCHDFEKRFGLPVRLLEPNEWEQIAPPPSVDRSQVKSSRYFTVRKGELPVDPIYDQLGWAVVGGDGKLGKNSSHCYLPNGVMSFAPNLHWASNSAGLQFLSVAGFCEWLSGYQNGRAPFAEAGRGIVAKDAGVFGSLEPTHLAMRREGAKVGFRLCYVAHPDA
jgi:hypothetical protein